MIPRVIIHTLISADGLMEGFSPEGIGLYYQLAGQLEVDTCLAGSDTLLAAESIFQPQILPEDLTEQPFAQPTESGGQLLVVPDSRGRIHHWSTHAQGMGARGVVVLVSDATPEEYLAYLFRRNIPHIRVGEGHVDYRAALEELCIQYGTQAIRTDSGGVLNSLLLQHGLVAELSLLISPELVGNQHRALFRTLEMPTTLSLQLAHCQPLGQGYVWLRYRVQA